MKKQIIFSFAIIGALAASCNKSWLEIVPQGSQVTTTTDDYDKLMNDPTFYINTTGGWAEMQLMGDEVAAETPFFINKNVIRDRLFQWADTVYAEVTAISTSLRTATTQMYQINKIVTEVMSSTGGTEAKKKGIQAEAKATRAWTLFNMANLFCKPYNASTAATDPGFPYTIDPKVTTEEFSRGTLQQTYDQIVKDLTEALDGIPQKQPILTRWSKPAVEGYLGKVYLFMGKPAEALPFLKAALADVLANGQTALYDYNVTFAAGGSFLPIDAQNGPKSPYVNQIDMKEAIVSKVYNSGMYGGNIYGMDGLVLTPQAQALFGASDLRLKFYTNKNSDNTVNASGRIRKYGAPFSAAYSRYGLQLNELYLLLAEAKARTNDLGGAVQDVETLRRNRMPVSDAPVPAAIAGNQTALIKFIIDERIREFAIEGYRWFDMRRLSVDPLFAGITFTHTMYNAGGTTTVYNMKLPNRLTVKLPRNIMDSNPGMQNNP